MKCLTNEIAIVIIDSLLMHQSAIHVGCDNWGEIITWQWTSLVSCTYNLFKGRAFPPTGSPSITLSISTLEPDTDHVISHLISMYEVANHCATIATTLKQGMPSVDLEF